MGHPAREPWTMLQAGTDVQVIKLRADGSESTKYPATVVDLAVPAPWVAVEAVWTRDAVERDGLTFTPTDHIHEYFSNRDPFNVFAVFSAERQLRGWYANVTYPSWMGHDGSLPAIYWCDLYVDVIGLPSGDVFVGDEDELEAAQSTFSDSSLLDMVQASRDELLRRFAVRAFPFHEQ